MSILSRILDSTLLKINQERVPTGLQMGGGFIGATGAPSPTGQIAQLSAMTSVGWLFAVVNRIAQSIATQDWKLYRMSNGEREEIDDHPAISLWRAANPFVTREDFLETAQQHMELVGEMWWVLVRNSAGVPVELQVVRPDRMRPIPHPTEFIAGYEYRLGGEAILLDKDDVIYTRNPNPLDAYRGIGVVQSMMVDLGAERAAAEWMQNFFRNSAEPGGIIEFPNGLGDSDFERLAQRWRFQHQGVANSHRVAILERGTWKERKFTNRDMQFEQLRRFERDQILGAFGMPLPIMGITESVNRSNAEAAEVMFARWVIRPRLSRIRAALNEKLLKLYPDGETLHFDFVDPVPENRVELTAEGTLGYEKQVLTLNEARRRFGEGDWEGPEGNERNITISVPAMAPPVSEESAEEETEEESATYQGPTMAKAEENELYPDEGNRSVSRMERGWARRLRTELEGLIEYLESASKSFDNNIAGIGQVTIKLTPGDVETYNWDWFAKYSEEVMGEIQSAHFAALAAEASEMSMPQMQLLASRYAEAETYNILRVDGAQNLPNQTRAEVASAVAETIEKGESLQTLSKSLRDGPQFSRNRARVIARTETAKALGEAKHDVAKYQG